MLYKLVDIINSISCFQLIIFSFLLIHKGRKSIPNIILAVFFIAQLIVILNFLLINFVDLGSSIHLKIAYIFYPFEYLWGPLMYYYVKSQVKQNFCFKIKDILHLIPFILVSVFIISYYYLSDVETKQTIVKNGYIYKWFLYFYIPYYLLLFTYNFFALFLIIKFERDLKNYCSFVVKRNLVWIKFVLYGYIVACIINATTDIVKQIYNVPWDVILLVLFTPFLIFFNILLYKAIINPYVIIMPDEKPKYSGSKLDNEDILKYSNNLEIFIKAEKPYLNPTLTLKDLSDQTGISDRIISQVINKQWNQNFFSFINAYRVNEAKILLDSFDQNKSTMIGISFDAGFNSKTAFYDAFKKQTGMTPSEYRKKTL